MNVCLKHSDTASRTLARFNVLFSWFGAILLARLESVVLPHWSWRVRAAECLTIHHATAAAMRQVSELNQRVFDMPHKREVKLLIGCLRCGTAQRGSPVGTMSSTLSAAAYAGGRDARPTN
jgi:hypothetical protein